MIKLIIFDMDGVLCDCKDMHYEALNQALIECDHEPISRQDHLTKFDGLNTKAKLKLLNISENEQQRIFDVKQIETLKLVSKFKPDKRIADVLSVLKMSGYMICVASNSIRETIESILCRKGFYHFDFYLSNQDVVNPKPHPEIYMRAMLRAGVSPQETLIVEDSPIGRRGAHESGARVCPVKDVSDVTLDKILSYTQGKLLPVKWDGGKLNVLIPMAGAGSRFVSAGYTFPKPLIEIKGEPMIKVVVDNLNLVAQYIFIVQQEHYDKYNLQSVLNLIAPGCVIVQVDGITQGAACTTLLAKEFIDNDTPLVIANSDQYLEWESAEFMYSMQNADAGIVSFRSTHPKWSYAKLNEQGYVCQVAEKNPISDIATAGVYYWAKGSDYVRSAEQMIAKNIRTNGEFYVCPTLNELILEGKKVKTFDIKKFHGLGTPEDLNNYLNEYL